MSDTNITEKLDKILEIVENWSEKMDELLEKQKAMTPKPNNILTDNALRLIINKGGSQ